MATMSKPQVSLDELHALADGRLSAQQQLASEERLTQDPQLQDTLTSWQAQRAALADLHREVLTEPAPHSMLHAAGRIAGLRQQSGQALRWVSAAASVLFAFGVGWYSHDQWLRQTQSSPLLAQSRIQHEFVRQAGLAHMVYVPEKRHLVEVAASEQEHLVQWLSKRVGKTLTVPNFSSFGYELVGGRLLPGDIGARAQFVFQNQQGQRITLYLGLVDKQPAGADLHETQFRYESGGGAPSFYWFDQGFGCALTGHVPKATLMALADSAYQQIWPEAKTP